LLAGWTVLPQSLAAEAEKQDRRPRLALCSSGGEKAGAIAALIEVELSQRDDVVLLDREHVKKILAEHQLQLKGLLSAEDALKVGQLLKCDVLAELHHDAATSENATVTSLVAFDSLTGVRLYDGALPVPGDLDERAAVASKALAMGLAKWQGGGTVPNCRTLSFVSIRQLDLPEDMSHASRTMGLLLERRLVNSPDVAILERERLDLIKKESKLTGLRRDRLLASSVLVDLDLLRGQQPDSLQASAVLTDGAGKTIGTLHTVGGVEDLGGLVNDLADAIFDKLKLTSTEGPTVVPGVETDRFLAEALRLELRGRKDEAAISEKAATMLAEAALARTPWNVRVQKVICRLLRRQTTRASNTDKALALLEQQIEYSDRWDYGEDTRWFTNGFARHLHQTLRRLGPGANTKRVRQLRDRFGRWCQRMAEQDPACIDGLVCVEAWSNSAGQMLEDVGRYLDTLPVGLGLARYSTATDYMPVPHQDHLYQPLHFSPAERKKLLTLYEGWGQGSVTIPDESDLEASLSRRLGLIRRMQSYVCAAFLVHRFSGEFEDAQTRVEHYLHQASEIVLEDPTLSGRFVHMCDARGPKPSPIYKPLRREAITGEVLWLVEELDGRRIACPTLLEYLDEHHADHADHPGAYLEKAWTQLDSPDYVPPRGDVLQPRFPEEFVERVEHTFRSRYGRDLEQVQPAEIEEAELESIERLFEFESVPGISSIESAELAGDWVYLLCLHPDPRSYEMRKVNLRTGKTEVLAEIVTDAKYRARTGNEIHVGADTVYAPTSDGVICFDRNAKKTWTITHEDGLPAARATACLEAGGRLYLGLRGRQEGYLAACDPSGGKVNVLACSGRKDKHSGLDDCEPYTIDSMVYDKSHDRIFIATMFLEPEASDRPWLWVYDVKSQNIHQVHQQPYHPLQLRLLPNGECLFHLADMHSRATVTRTLPNGVPTQVAVRVPSANGARGYGLWEPRDFTGSPLANMQEHIIPLIGNVDPEKLKVHYRIPTFCGKSHAMPGTTSSLALFDEHHLISSAVRRTPLALDPPREPYMIEAQAGYGKRWQLIPRDDTAGRARDLPLLDEEAPFMVRIHDGRIVACTQGGIWLIQPRLGRRGQLLADGETPQAEDSSQDGVSVAVGTLVVESPLGSFVQLDGSHGYRTWKNGRLTWNDLQPEEYAVDVEYLGRSFNETIDLRANGAATVKASFGEEAVRTRSLDLGGGCQLKLVWVPPDTSEEAAKFNVSYGDGFWLGQHEVTQQEYEAVMGGNPSTYRGAAHPVDKVGRNEANRFCQRVTQKCAGQLAGLSARLPSTSEWGHACRAGASSKYNTGDTEDDLLRAGWMPDNSFNRSHPVGLKMCNRFWLHDMHGNVAEWCERDASRGGSWRSRDRTSLEATGFRILVTKPDSELGRDREGWMHLSYVDPIHAKIGWGTFVRYKGRDWKPGIGGTRFHTVMYVHANSSVKYKLDGKYTQFLAHYGLWTGAHGVCQFVVLTDGEERFRSGFTWGLGGTSTIGVKHPVTLDITGVDVLELRAVQAGDKPLANACGLWGDARIK